jgi:type IV fimbrial biogenesis protein FimT
MTMRSRNKGFTLVELMVTLAVAIILLAVGMPLFSGMAANNRATAQANTFLAGFKLARSEAVKRGLEVSVCAIDDPDDDPSTPVPSPVNCGDEEDWPNGLLVFTDPGLPEDAGSVDGTDERLKLFANPVAGATVATTGGFVRFAPQGEVDGMTANGGDCASSGTCLELGQHSAASGYTHCLHVMQSGQIRLERGACR